MNKKDQKRIERYRKKLELVRSGAIANPFETPEEKEKRIKELKADVKKMVEYYLPHYATSECADFHVEWANEVYNNPVFKGFAQWGRGLAKSVWNNVVIPLWLWMNDVPTYFVIIGNNYDKAEQLLEDIKAEFEANERLINDFGEQKTAGSWEDGFFITQSGFIGQALGMGQSVRGLRIKNLRPTHFNCDDMEDKKLVKNPKRQNEMVKWIERDVIPCMDGPLRRFTYSNNRFAPVMIQTKLQEKHPKWKVHEIKAYNPVTYKPAWPQKYDDNYYKSLEDDEEVGLLAALAEYNNDPHIEGEIFKEEYINWSVLPPEFDMIVCHWDIAYAGNENSDFNAVRIWGYKDKKYYLIACFVKQSKMRFAVDFMCDFRLNQPDLNIHFQYESQFWNDEVHRVIEEAQEANNVELNLVQVDTVGNKYDRITSTLGYYYNSRIYYNEALKNDKDTIQGKAQLLGIEPGYSGHDDAPDADEQCIKYLSKHARMNNYAKPVTGNYESKNRY